MSFKVIIITLTLIGLTFISWFIGIVILTLEKGNKKIKEAFLKQNKILQLFSAIVLGFGILFIIYTIVKKNAGSQNGGDFIGKRISNMNTRFGHVTYTKLGIRHQTLRLFCYDFDIEIVKKDKNSPINSHDKDCYLDDNFVFFLLENKTFIRIYDLDYYTNKTVEIISNKIGRKVTEIEDYLRARKYQIDKKYPFRYISSYKIDYDLGGNYTFLKYETTQQYDGNFECRRSLFDK